MLNIQRLRPAYGMCLRLMTSGRGSQFTFARRTSAVRRPGLVCNSTAADEERKFHNNADATLSAVETSCAVLEDIIDGLDISSSMGVLTIKLGDKGTRYEWDASRAAWVNTRDRHLMLDSLAKEMELLTGQHIRFT